MSGDAQADVQSSDLDREDERYLDLCAARSILNLRCRVETFVRHSVPAGMASLIDEPFGFKNLLQVQIEGAHQLSTDRDTQAESWPVSRKVPHTQKFWTAA